MKTNETKRAKKTFDEFNISNNNQLVLEVDNNVVGFVNYGRSEDNEYPNCWEIFALYIISKYKGNGFGKKLVDEAKKELKLLGFNNMIICLSV